MAEPLLSIRGLRKGYRSPSGVRVDALAGVDIDIAAGETLGLVGESGCGKTTLGRAAMLLPPPDAGGVALEGIELTALPARQLRAIRPRMQMVFQDPVSSLNPKRSIADAVATPLLLHARLPERELRARVDAMLEAVGLDPVAMRDRLPHELSGGQCQRASIARALVLQPRLLLCDEPVSSLDVSIQAQIVNLLLDSKQRFDLTMLFIAHDIAVVRHVSDRVAVMYLGRVCEILPSDDLASRSAHPYTRLLLDSIPGHAGGNTPTEHRSTATPLAPPSGCRFRLRCPLASARCASEEPALREHAPGHQVACHHVD